jgi:putative ABC transport system permease protein
VLGTVGGIVGTTLGITTILAVALMQDWSAIMPSWLPASFGLGTLTGLLAGLYPAWQATRIEPADALRR